MERTKGIRSGAKKLLMAVCLAAALASTGCGQNALLNPTADQVAAGTSQTANKAAADLNPAAADLNP